MVDVSYISDDELNRLYYEKQRRRTKLKRNSNHEKAKVVEVEICYIQREITTRRARRDAHKKWLQEKSKNRR
tara:strand:- start:2222 stop:2437 length:216 start_codon:yes stop_codon:yes gene_type:complete